MTSIKIPKRDDRKKSFDRRSSADRRKATNRRSGTDRRSGWGEINEHLLEGALTAAATIVHQFSQPFTIIIGYIDLILSTTEEEDTQRKLKIIRNQLKLIVKILHNFRELHEYETVDFDGLNLLNLKLDEENEDERYPLI